jgi:NADPH:quinone reductase-like Zn-dependent oxidoreductase
MRAFTIDAPDAAPALGDVPAPAPGDGELLVRVQASSVNPVDTAIAAGMLQGMVEHEYPITLGRDFAGVVEQTGSRASRFAPGDAVYGFMRHAAPAVHAGSWAELIAVPESAVAARPVDVPLEAAGATPLAGITALASIDALDLQPGQAVLIVGATGGVGSFAVQLAAAAGAHVIATARDDDHEFLGSLGASELVDRDGDVAAAVRATHPDGVDAILDVVSYTPEAFGAYALALTDGGHAASPLGAVGDAPGHHAIMAMPDPAALDRLSALLAAGTLRVPVQRTYAFAEVGDALAALPATHSQGKLAISVS